MSLGDILAPLIVRRVLSEDLFALLQHCSIDVRIANLDIVFLGELAHDGCTNQRTHCLAGDSHALFAGAGAWNCSVVLRVGYGFTIDCCNYSVRIRLSRVGSSAVLVPTEADY